MANLFKRTYTKIDRWSGKRKRCKVCKWYSQYRDADGIKQRVSLCMDKMAAQAMLNEIVQKEE